MAHFVLVDGGTWVNAAYIVTITPHPNTPVGCTIKMTDGKTYYANSQRAVDIVQAAHS